MSDADDLEAANARIVALQAVANAAKRYADNIAEFGEPTDAVYLDMLTNALYDVGMWPERTRILREAEY